MAKNLWEYFNCTDKQDLYHKLKINDPSVKELADFYKNYQASIQPCSLNKPEAVGTYLENKNLFPQEDSFSVLTFDTKLHPIKCCNFSYSDSFKKVFENVYLPGCEQFIFINHPNPSLSDASNQKIKKLTSQLKEFFSLNTLDCFDVKYDSDRQNNVLYSQEGQYIAKEIKAFPSHCVKEGSIRYTQPVQSSVETQLHFPEFSNFYAINELKGLNVLSDQNTILRWLQVGYSDLKQERLDMICYDSNYKIQSVDTLSVGNVNSSIFPLAQAVKLIPERQAGGAIVFHNHPSGISTPSVEDINSMKKAVNACQLVDKELWDGYVVGKDKVFSFAKDGNKGNPLFHQMACHQNEVEQTLNEDVQKSDSYESIRYEDEQEEDLFYCDEFER